MSERPESDAAGTASWKTTAGIVALVVVGIVLVVAAGQGTAFGPIWGLCAVFVVLPLLISALLDERLSARALGLGSMLAVVVTIVIGLVASGFPVDQRATVATVGLGFAVVGAGLTGAWVRRGRWIPPFSRGSLSRPRLTDVAVLGVAALALIAAVAFGVSTPTQPTPYVALSVTTTDGTALPEVVVGKTGSSSPVLVNIKNALPATLQGTLVIGDADGPDSIPFDLMAGAEQAFPVQIRIGAGLSTARIELHANDAGQDRLVVLRLNGT